MLLNIHKDEWHGILLSFSSRYNDDTNQQKKCCFFRSNVNNKKKSTENVVCTFICASVFAICRFVHAFYDNVYYHCSAHDIAFLGFYWKFTLGDCRRMSFGCCRNDDAIVGITLLTLWFRRVFPRALCLDHFSVNGKLKSIFVGCNNELHKTAITHSQCHLMFCHCTKLHRSEKCIRNGCQNQQRIQWKMRSVKMETM